ncbi:hypothetical protein PSSHI_08450 [Photobacterium sp. R1]
MVPKPMKAIVLSVMIVHPIAFLSGRDDITALMRKCYQRKSGGAGEADIGCYGAKKSIGCVTGWCIEDEGVRPRLTCTMRHNAAQSMRCIVKEDRVNAL